MCLMVISCNGSQLRIALARTPSLFIARDIYELPVILVELIQFRLQIPETRLVQNLIFVSHRKITSLVISGGVLFSCELQS